MSNQTPINLVKEFESDRDRIIFEIRENFIFVYKNGGSEKYTFEKLAERIKEVIPESKISKKEVKDFLDGATHFPRMDIEKVLTLLKLSINLRQDVELHVQEAKRLIEESRAKWSNPREPKP